MTGPSMPFKGAIFDVDGVLVASPHERAWRDSLDQLMAHEWAAVARSIDYDRQRFTTAFYQEVMAGKPRLSGARAALDAFAVPDAERRAVEYARVKQEQIAQLIEAGAFAAFPDAVPFVVGLKARGLRLAASSSSKNAPRLMQAIEVEGYGRGGSADGANPGSLLDLFDVDVSGRDLPMGKPDPSIFLLAANELGLDPTMCLVVEDAPAGILAGKAGGMRTLGIARAHDERLLVDSGADLVVTSLDHVNMDALAAGRLESCAPRLPRSTRG